MKIKIDSAKLKHLSRIMYDLGEAIASSTHNGIMAYDYGQTRRVSYMPDIIEASTTQDVGINTDILQKVSRRASGTTDVIIHDTHMDVITERATYKLRVFESQGWRDEPKTTSTGMVTIPAADMLTALEDVAAAGLDVVVITIDDDTVLFRGDKAADCRIAVPTAKPEGIGYSRLDMALLMPCIPRMDCIVTIQLSPKGPTLMRFGDDITYHQAPRL